MTANLTEFESWNGARGQGWVRTQAEMDAFLAPLLDLALDLAQVKPGMAVLDIGCGAGATTLAAARAVGPKGRALGLDFSAPLLDLARARASGIGNVAFLGSDAQTHRFAPEFDVMISRFGVMFFDDPVAAFANMAQALRPGGRMAVLAWSGLDQNPFFSLPVRVAEPWLGPSAPLGDAPGPMAFANIARVEAILRAAGLVEVSGTPIDTFVTPPGTLDATVDLALDSGPAARLIATQAPTEEVLQAIRRACRQAMQPFATESGMRIPACVNLFRATKSG